MECVKLVPHERSLVERYKDKPFVLVGVNSDAERDTAKEAIGKRQMAWRSWWDGADGHIAAQWHVKFFPSIYVLDGRGVVRYVNVRGAELEQAIDALLAEAGQINP
jgi:hypothetical protein